MCEDLRDLAARLGGDYHGDYAVLPGPGHSHRDRSLSVTLGDGGRVIYNSFAGDPHDQVQAYLNLDVPDRSGAHLRARRPHLDLARRREAEQDRARKLAFCKAVWDGAGQAAGSPVARYLAGRGLNGPLLPTLRFHDAAPLDYGHHRSAPSMVAIVQDVRGAPCGLHVTALKPDGSGKADGGKSRRMFGPVRGGSVRLGSPTAGRLAVAEGIETALSFAALESLPTWAALSTSGLEGFRPPPGVETLVIAADGDPPGLLAARRLAELARRSCDVTLAAAPDGQDWNDVLVGGAR